MKMYYGDTPIKSLKIKHYEVSTHDATVKPSDLQTGVTAYAKGQKVTGTGKSFEFAEYGLVYTNFPIPIPATVNIIEVASTVHPIQMSVALSDMKNIDFSKYQTIGDIIINDIKYPIATTIEDDSLILNCDKTLEIEVFYGKDNYV